MTIRAALYTYLTDTLVVEVGDRVYASKAAEGATLPYIRYSRVSGVRTYFHQAFEDTAPWAEERFQFDCTAITPEGAETLGDALIEALSGLRGDVEGVTIGDTRLVSDLDRHDPQTKLFRRVLDFVISHHEVSLVS